MMPRKEKKRGGSMEGNNKGMSGEAEGREGGEEGVGGGGDRGVSPIIVAEEVACGVPIDIPRRD
jgi:hypothetical protein